MAKVADKFLEVNPWMLMEKDFHPTHSRVSEAVFSLGNEFMGVRGYFDEGYSGDSLIGSYLNGVYSEVEVMHPNTYKGITTRMPFMVNTVDWLYTRISIDGETLDLAKSKVSDFYRELDLRSGTVKREYVWHTKSGKAVKVSFERFLSMVDPNLAYQKVSFKPINFSGSIEVKSGLDFTPIHEAASHNFWNCPKKGQENGAVAIIGLAEKSGHQVFSSFSLSSNAALDTKYFEEEKIAGLSFTLSVEEGKETYFDKKVINYAVKQPGVDTDKVWSDGFKTIEKYSSADFDSALQRHVLYWTDVWNKLDIKIEGDDENQQGIRFCIFQLHQTYHGQDPANNVGAKGLTGEAYSGHTYWDTETYCLPFFIFNNPKAARNLLEYRYKTLPQAIEWGEIQDCKGAQYPFGTIDGTEGCGVWWHGNLEIHVSVAVAYGIWHYVKLTGDKDFLYKEGIEMLIEISRFHATRGNWNPNGEYGFFGVMGPDEFHTFVNNNCYTNVMAKKMFEYTIDVLNEMKTNAPDKFSSVASKVKLNDEELVDWKSKAENMRIPLDKETGIYEQHDGFFGLPHLDIHSIPVEDFPLYHNWALVRIYRYDMIKQPDVLLFQFFFSNEYSDESKKVNYEYYEPRCIHESSLSPSVHSIMASELGKHEEAYEFFKFATRLDIDNYNRNSREGLHTTSMAGAWMNIIYGFGGMRTDGDVLTFRPSIPKAWKSFSYMVLYKGSSLKVTISKENVELKIMEGSDIPVKVFEKDYTVTSEGIIIKLPEDRIA